MKVSVCEFYIRVNHTWKKVGILATGCRRYGAKSNAKWQKTTICRTQPEIKGELRLVRKDNFLVAVVFEFFSRYGVNIYIMIIIRMLTIK